jgi:pyruvate,water dikinase
MPNFIRWFENITLQDLPLVGGKNASLGEMYGALAPLGVKIPNGFAIKAYAYWHTLDSAGVRGELQSLLAGLNKQDVAVRSSATAEDLPGASFAGQQESYLNIRGYAALRDACSKCFASLFTDRAISYRMDQGFDHFQVALSIGVQKMVRSDLAASGVIFTLDTETGFRDVVFITGTYGLGENIVQGAVDPDEFYVFKPTFKTGHRSIIRRRLGGETVTHGLCRGWRRRLYPQPQRAGGRARKFLHHGRRDTYAQRLRTQD